MTYTLAELTTLIHANSVGHGWWEDERHPLEVLFLISQELAEAGEEYRNGHELTEVYYQDGKPEGFPVELADVLIRLLDYCGQLGIDMEEVLLCKHRYNLTRPYRHGGKVA